MFFELNGERLRVHAAEMIESPPPFPVPGTILDDQLSIACNPGAIRPTLIQRAGRGAMGVAELLRGFSIAPGTRLD